MKKQLISIGKQATLIFLCISLLGIRQLTLAQESKSTDEKKANPTSEQKYPKKRKSQIFFSETDLNIPLKNCKDVKKTHFFKKLFFLLDFCIF